MPPTKKDKDEAPVVEAPVVEDSKPESESEAAIAANAADAESEAAADAAATAGDATTTADDPPPADGTTPPTDPDPLPPVLVVSDPRRGSPWMISGVYPRISSMTDFDLVQEIRGWSVVPALPDQHDLSRHEAEQYLMLLNRRAETSGPYPAWDDSEWRESLHPHEDDWMNFPLSEGIEAGLDPIDDDANGNLTPVESETP